jgi:multidrug resistance efflux pump
MRASLEAALIDRGDVKSKSDPAPRFGGSPDLPMARADAAVQEMKVKLDLMREELKAERAMTKKVTELLKQTAALLDDAVQSREALDKAADGYSYALTQLVTDDDDARLR